MGQTKPNSALDFEVENQAVKSSTDPERSFCLNEKELQTLQKSPKFMTRLLFSPRTHRPYFYFKWHGMSLEGFLGISQDNRGVNRSKSYLIETENGWEEFFANQHLQRIFEKNKLEGRYIRITYVGDEMTGWGHARKIYRVDLLPIKQRQHMTWNTEPLPKPKEKK